MCRRDYNPSTVNLLKLRTKQPHDDQFVTASCCVAPPAVVSWKLQECKTVILPLTFVFHLLPAFPATTFKVKVE